jgi:hypothetical protein
LIRGEFGYVSVLHRIQIEFGGPTLRFNQMGVGALFKAAEA